MDAQVDAVRRFNRFYTAKIGVLEERLHDSRFSLTEVRVLWELAHGTARTATELGATLGIDAGYLSRILHGFAKKRLISRTPSPADRRRSALALTAAGKKALAPLDAAARKQVAGLLAPLAAGERERLVEALATVERLLGAPAVGGPITLREPRAGDLGWVVERHGHLYADEYGWNAAFEALVAEIMARFAQEPDQERQRGWIAEQGGRNVGCVFVVQRTRTVAQLRCLLVEPALRGQGLGARLVDECIRFARAQGYRDLMLWTNDVLRAARRVYERAGFVLVEEEKHDRFGRDLVGQSWSRRL